MGGGIYLLQDGGGLLEMREEAYDSEAFLQELLAKYPNLLAGDQIHKPTSIFLSWPTSPKLARREISRLA